MSSFYKCVPKIIIMIYASWDMERYRQFFVTLDHLLPFYPPNNPENQNFAKMNEGPGDVIILHMCTINDHNMMCGSWDMEPNRQFFVILDHFLPFTRPPPPPLPIFCTFTPLKTRRTDRWKKQHIEVGAPPNNDLTCNTIYRCIFMARHEIKEKRTSTDI